MQLIYCPQCGLLLPAGAGAAQAHKSTAGTRSKLKNRFTLTSSFSERVPAPDAPAPLPLGYRNGRPM